MSKPVKVLTICLWILAVAGMLGVVALQLWTRDRQAHADAGPRTDVASRDGTGVSAAPPRIYPVNAPKFALTDQLGRKVTTESLGGHPWVADFIFSQCATACPVMTQRLSEMQSTIPPDVKFVSFSVDPANDTPAALLAYARTYKADNDRWRFLTGDKSAVLEAVRGMKTSMKDADATGPIQHDVHYLLMDSAGRMRGVYDSQSPGMILQLEQDAKTLSAEGGGGKDGTQ